MEEDIRKQGMLYLQQQRFGKKWKRVWCVLYRESSCSISRLEFFECKDGGNLEKNDKSLRKQLEHKKVIRLSDCIRVSEGDVDGCPRDTASFLVETTEKIYVFAADRNQLGEWMHRLCEVAFPMSWTDSGVKRSSLQRGARVDGDEGLMEDNSLYSGRDAVRDFRVCVRRTEASERCRLKGDGILRADVDALALLDKTGSVLYTWPYHYLRRFGRDKSTFSFEAGRRCNSGEGNFEFETKQGNFLFQAVEASINLQKVGPPHRQISGGPDYLPPLPVNPAVVQSRTLPQPQPRGTQIPESTSAQDGVYSLVSEKPNLPMMHHKDKEASAGLQLQQRPLLARLEPPIDKSLTGVKSLNLDSRSLNAPRKNQVKMISSCPLPYAGIESSPSPTPRLGHNRGTNPVVDQTYSQITSPGGGIEHGTKREKSGSPARPHTPPLITKESEYSLPFDTIAKNTLSDILANSCQDDNCQSGADPLYDSIDEMKVRNIFTDDNSALSTLRPACGKVEHIYDEPEGCATIASPEQNSSSSTSLYDDPEEVRGNAWKIMGTTVDPKGHEYPYNPRVDDYAVPKRPQRAFPAPQSTNEEEKQETGEKEEELEKEEEEELREEPDSPYNNVMVKMVKSQQEDGI
ncbi:docking protein 2 [Pholidichthys leucotaenia]